MQKMNQPGRSFSGWMQAGILIYPETSIHNRILKLHSSQADRKFQIWERRPFWKTIGYDESFIQKLKYIHLNPIRKKWNLAKFPEDYAWSSAKSYFVLEPEFEFLTLKEFS